MEFDEFVRISESRLLQGQVMSTEHLTEKWRQLTKLVGEVNEILLMIFLCFDFFVCNLVKNKSLTSCPFFFVGTGSL